MSTQHNPRTELEQASANYDKAARKAELMQMKLMHSFTKEENDRNLKAYHKAQKKADQLFEVWIGLGGSVS